MEYMSYRVSSKNSCGKTTRESQNQFGPCPQKTVKNNESSCSTKTKGPDEIVEHLRVA